MGRRRLDKDLVDEEYPRLSDLVGGPEKGRSNAWIAAFSESPDAMYSLLSDIIKIAHAKPGGVGQRPMPYEEEVDLEALLHGEVSNEPMVKILPRMITDSETVFAEKVKMSRSMVNRILNGKYEPDVGQIRRIASALNVPPAYFLEYRQMMVIAAMYNYMNEHPNVATLLYKKHLTVKAGKQ